MKPYLSHSQISMWQNMVLQIAQQMKTGNAPPNPNGWWCSPKWCGYWDLCKTGFMQGELDILRENAPQRHKSSG